MDKIENARENNLLRRKIVASLILIPLGWIIVASGIWLFFDLIRKVLSLFGIMGRVLIFLSVFLILFLWHLLIIKWVRIHCPKKENISG